MKRHARYLSILLALMMVFSTAAVFAEGEETMSGDSTIVTDVVPEADADSATLGTVSEGEAVEPFTTTAPVITAFKKKYDKDDFEGAKDNGYTLKWSHANATGVDAYQALRWKKGSAAKAVVKTVNAGGSYSFFVLVPSGTYYYLVRAIQYKEDGKTIANSVESSAKYATVSGVITATSGINWYCKAKRTAVIYKKGSGSAKLTKVKKGTKMSAIGRYPAVVKKYHYAERVKVTYTVKGKKVTGWIKWKDLKGGVKASTIVKKDYTRSLKEQFVNETYNKKGPGKKATPIAKSKDNTLVWVCLHTQRAYTFKWDDGKWSLYHTDRITSGKYSQPTRSTDNAGYTKFTITKKVPGKVWMVQENGKRYYFTTVSYVGTKIGKKGSVSFHTGTWWESGKTRVVVSKAGKPGTYGCIRMTNGGASFMYKHTHVNKTAIIITMYD